MPRQIIIIEDNKETNKALRVGLEKAGYQSHSALSGEAGLLMYDQIGADLVITDIVMPAMNGIEVIRHLVAKDVTPKIIAVSGQGDTHLEAAKEFGVDDVLTKPLGQGREEGSRIAKDGD